MSKYIDTEKQLVRLYSLGLNCEDVVRQFLLTAPAADVAEVRHGHWINVNGDGTAFRCSVCGEISCCNSLFCGDCGAKMDKVSE